MNLRHTRIKNKLKQIQAGLNLLSDDDLNALEQVLDATLDIIDDNDDNENDNH
jgi:hypothetical protein